MELGSVATSVIKTTGSAQTRNADVISKTGLGSVLPQTEGWVYAEVDVRLLSIARRGLSFTNDLTATILNGFIYSVASTNLHQVILRANNAEVFRIETAASAGIAKVLFRFASGNSKLFINAVESGVRTQSFSFTGLVDVMALGSTQNGTNQLIDPIHSYAIGSGPITDAQAQSLTSL
jgi:archaellum component FlaF (FlaF/FlaG flagellin family)